MDLLNLVVWDKAAGGIGNFYRSHHELIFPFRKAGTLQLNRMELGKHGRNRANIWTYEAINGFDAKRAKPEKCIRQCPLESPPK